MAGLNFWFCVISITFSFVINCESRSFPPLITHSERPALIQSAREAIKESLRRKEIAGNWYEFNRFSPGGPDPKHH
ncbi:hypothetical protein CDL12_06432 [Handroanthus impetiginosus]|uniref:Uncharacterized protein n=1 Tax=Handroanthus impetiginosus TaxID=429701 RepID=A0A2G9HTM8_9LAMI|nr:hypothetical protein CDL12_06432 [Handroanthus impetiginosus]